MKKIIVKILSLSLVGCMLFSLSACNKKETTSDSSSEIKPVESYTYQEVFGEQVEKNEIPSELEATISASDYIKIPVSMKVPKLFTQKPNSDYHLENPETRFYSRIWKDKNNPDVIYVISEYIGSDVVPVGDNSNLALKKELGISRYVCMYTMTSIFGEKWDTYPDNFQMFKKTDVTTSKTDVYKQKSDMMEFTYTYYQLGKKFDTEYIYVTGNLVMHYALPIQIWAIDTSKDHIYKDDILKMTRKIAKSLRVTYPDNEPK